MSKAGYSDSIPYAAGILAMGWQVRPDIGPGQMRSLLFKSAFTHKSGAKIINPRKFILMAKRAKAAPRQNQRQRISPVRSKTNIIVPGVGVGDYKLGMSRAQLVKIIKNKGGSTQLQGNSIDFDGLLIGIKDDLVKGITVFNPRYKFANGLGRGSSEQKVIETFGNNYDLREFSFKNILTYKKRHRSYILQRRSFQSSWESERSAFSPSCGLSLL